MNYKKNNLLHCDNNLLKTPKDAFDNQYYVDSAEYKVESVSLKNKKSSSISELSLPYDDDKFAQKMNDFGYSLDKRGIYLISGEAEIVISNIKRINYCHTLQGEDNDSQVRIVSINDIVFSLEVRHLANRTEFQKILLGKSNLYFHGDKKDFDALIKIILELDNGIIVKKLPGYGKVNPGIFHFGRTVLFFGELTPYQEIMYNGDIGYMLESCNKLNIKKEGWNISDIYDNLQKIYGQKAWLALSYAAATLYYDSIFPLDSSFPIFFLHGPAGSGKSKLAELIAAMLGANNNFFTVNCQSLSTPVGIDIKAQSLQNLPLILNEADRHWDDYLKTRFDGQGTFKANPNSHQTTAERRVTGSTIAIYVEKPNDTVPLSRCVLVDLGDIEKNKVQFEKLYQNRHDLSRFTYEILTRGSSEAFVGAINEFKSRYLQSGLDSRTLHNYAIIGGCLIHIVKIFGDELELDEKSVSDYIEGEMKKAEKRITPLYSIISEILEIISENETHDFICHDETLVYVHMEGFLAYYQRNHKSDNHQNIRNLKKMFAQSKFIAKYHDDFSCSSNYQPYAPAISYQKKINGKPKKCLVLKLECFK